MQIEERLLDERAHAFVLRRLRDHGLELSQALAGSFPAQARVGALVPEESTDATVYDFEHGGLLPEGRPSRHTHHSILKSMTTTKKELAAIACRFLYEYPDTLLICEAVNYHLPGAKFERAGIRVLLTDQYAYPVLAMHASQEQVLETIRLSFDFSHSLIALSRLGEDVDHWIDTRRTLTVDDLLRVVQGFRWGALGAYDGESYVLWSASEPS